MLFKATAASLGAAIADGPIPAGDALFIIMKTLTVSYLAANWEEIGPKWNSIDRLLKNIFFHGFICSRTSNEDLKAKVLDKVSEKIGRIENLRERFQIQQKKEVKRKLGSEALKKFKEAVKKVL